MQKNSKQRARCLEQTKLRVDSLLREQKVRYARVYGGLIYMATSQHAVDFPAAQEVDVEYSMIFPPLPASEAAKRVERHLATIFDHLQTERIYGVAVQRKNDGQEIVVRWIDNTGKTLHPGEPPMSQEALQANMVTGVDIPRGAEVIR